MKTLCRVLPLVLVALLQTGCMTAHLLDNHGMVREYFYGLGPVHQQEEAIYVQGMTSRRWEDGSKLKYRPSYMIFSVANNRVVKTKWVIPGELPEEILATPELPCQQESCEGARERFDDFCKTQPPAKFYCSGNELLIRNPDDPNSPNRCSASASRRFRALSAYPTLCLILPITVLFDVVTSPIQLPFLIGLSRMNVCDASKVYIEVSGNDLQLLECLASRALHFRLRPDRRSQKG